MAELFLGQLIGHELETTNPRYLTQDEQKQHVYFRNRIRAELAEKRPYKVMCESRSLDAIIEINGLLTLVEIPPWPFAR